MSSHHMADLTLKQLYAYDFTCSKNYSRLLLLPLNLVAPKSICITVIEHMVKTANFRFFTNDESRQLKTLTAVQTQCF